MRSVSYKRVYWGELKADIPGVSNTVYLNTFEALFLTGAQDNVDSVMFTVMFTSNCVKETGPLFKSGKGVFLITQLK